MKICKIDGCTKKMNARGLCGLHYRHAQERGEFGNKCSIDGCGKQCVGSSLCSTHYAAKYRKENREAVNSKMREYQKIRRKTGKDKNSALKAGERYRKRNLEKFAVKERIRRGKKRANGGSYSYKDWVRLVNRFSGMCAYCGECIATTADHVIPINKGGTNFIGNILPACVSCNSSKQDTLLFEWKKNVRSTRTT